MQLEESLLNKREYWISSCSGIIIDIYLSSHIETKSKFIKDLR